MGCAVAVIGHRARVAVRDSVASAARSTLLDRQREQCEALAAYRHWEVVETYIDQSKSATDRWDR